MLSSLFLSTQPAAAEVICDQMIQRRTPGQDCLKYPGAKYTAISLYFLSIRDHIIHVGALLPRAAIFMCIKEEKKEENTYIPV